MKTLNHMHENFIFPNSSQKNWVSRGMICEVLGVKMTPKCPSGYFRDPEVITKIWLKQG